jgi:hypothetical protein
MNSRVFISCLLFSLLLGGCGGPAQSRSQTVSRTTSSPEGMGGGAGAGSVAVSPGSCAPKPCGSVAGVTIVLQVQRIALADLAAAIASKDGFTQAIECNLQSSYGDCQSTDLLLVRPTFTYSGDGSFMPQFVVYKLIDNRTHLVVNPIPGCGSGPYLITAYPCIDASTPEEMRSGSTQTVGWLFWSLPSTDMSPNRKTPCSPPSAGCYAPTVEVSWDVTLPPLDMTIAPVPVTTAPSV